MPILHSADIGLNSTPARKCNLEMQLWIRLPPSTRKLATGILSINPFIKGI